MQQSEHIYDQRTFDDESLKCTKCGWTGKGSETRTNENFGPGKFRQVICPKCNESLGKLSKDKSFGEGGK